MHSVALSHAVPPTGSVGSPVEITSTEKEKVTRTKVDYSGFSLLNIIFIDITFIVEFPSSSSSAEKERTSPEQRRVFQLFSQTGQKI